MMTGTLYFPIIPRTASYWSSPIISCPNTSGRPITKPFKYLNHPAFSICHIARLMANTFKSQLSRNHMKPSSLYRSLKSATLSYFVPKILTRQSIHPPIKRPEKVISVSSQAILLLPMNAGVILFSVTFIVAQGFSSDFNDSFSHLSYPVKRSFFPVIRRNVSSIALCHGFMPNAPAHTP